ncbi:hypothetical protein FB446DRAFT_792567 [Lentinula raphanica]|nr:hypothetical protein FB446DRAFT_792567 [Lentinula raphanica]
MATPQQTGLRRSDRLQSAHGSLDSAEKTSPTSRPPVRRTYLERNKKKTTATVASASRAATHCTSEQSKISVTLNDPEAACDPGPSGSVDHEADTLSVKARSQYSQNVSMSKFDDSLVQKNNDWKALVEELRLEIQCLICRDLTCQPYMLECGHIYCAECLMKERARTEKTITGFHCPICKKPTTHTPHLVPVVRNCSEAIARITGETMLPPVEFTWVPMRPRPRPLFPRT